MRNFIILWLGQMVSSIGSSMTYFALTLWVWQQTESVTPIALITFSFQLPQLGIALFSGILVDRVSRKQLLILSDTAAACCTLAVGVLYAAQQLQLWHLYLLAAILGCFESIQSLTYTTTLSLIVPKQHHTRASSMGAMVEYGAAILSPAFAGILYPIIGLLGITLVDLSTFVIAIATLLVIPIPNIRTQNEEENPASGIRRIWQNATYGFRYIGSRRSLLAMVIVMSSFAFLNQIGETLYQPMILARTGGSAQILGAVVTASGVGGVIGAIALSVWGGFRSQVSNFLFGLIGTGLGKLVLGVAQLPAIWVIAQFGDSLHSPLIQSSYMTIWYARVAPEQQGRVFAADYLIGVVIEGSANLVAGPLADRVFEPAMQSGKWLTSIVGSIVGTGTGSGITLLYVLHAVCILLIGIGGFILWRIRQSRALTH